MDQLNCLNPIQGLTDNRHSIKPGQIRDQSTPSAGVVIHDHHPGAQLR